MQLTANHISLEVEQHGSPQGEPLLLVMGLGMQLVAWHDDFVAGLVARGFRVIRFDNRDIGLSQPFDDSPVPNLAVEAIRHALGLRVHSAYSLADMADDSVGVLDALGIERAHVCGVSMGGMIAQHLAARHPRRVASLTLMMTTSGARRLPGPTWKVRQALLARPQPATDIAGIVEQGARFFRLIGSPAYPSTDAFLRDGLGVAVRRSYRPRGAARQLLAVAAEADRSALLAGVSAPTQVIHGTADPLVPLPAGRDLAAKITGATLDVVDGMGHDLPVELWPRFTSGIAAAAARA